MMFLFSLQSSSGPQRDHNLLYMLFWFQGTDASQVSSALDLAASFASMKLN